MSAPTQMAHYKNLRQIFDKYMCTLGKGSEDVWLMSGVDKKMVAGKFFLGLSCYPVTEILLLT